ncbi:hypothetical protein K490DRAFT_62181 [Saccharata proteae CBS 121410]|uniref:Uncharacterized protein n=1 Tax=Saccharata proteae CBS 121410 TaxID=1314787 RepID=A0A9P4LXR3_9PEZI|nr:hypothetical protein K490DRAFT_62181 [Saccharata proteae CBS 121410]
MNLGNSSTTKSDWYKTKKVQTPDGKKKVTFETSDPSGTRIPESLKDGGFSREDYAALDELAKVPGVLGVPEVPRLPDFTEPSTPPEARDSIFGRNGIFGRGGIYGREESPSPDLLKSVNFPALSSFSGFGIPSIPSLPDMKLRNSGSVNYKEARDRAPNGSTTAVSIPSSIPPSLPKISNSQRANLPPAHRRRSAATTTKSAMPSKVTKPSASTSQSGRGRGRPKAETAAAAAEPRTGSGRGRTLRSGGAIRAPSPEVRVPAGRGRPAAKPKVEPEDREDDEAGDVKGAVKKAGGEQVKLMHAFFAKHRPSFADLPFRQRQKKLGEMWRASAENPKNAPLAADKAKAEDAD